MTKPPEMLVQTALLCLWNDIKKIRRNVYSITS